MHFHLSMVPKKRSTRYVLDDLEVASPSGTEVASRTGTEVAYPSGTVVASHTETAVCIVTGVPATTNYLAGKDPVASADR